MHNTDLNDLLYVAAVTHSGSLSAAARQLGVNHATVFRRITQLEKTLGVRLFERSSGRYVATSAGEELARAGGSLQETADQALLKVAGRDLHPSGMVRLTTTDSVAKSLLGPILLLCRQRYPQITLHISIDNAMFNLSRRDADIAIRPSRQPPEHLLGKCIGPLGFALYASTSYLAENGDKPLAAQQWLALGEAQERHRSLQWLASLIPLEQIGCRFESFGAIAQACHHGLGVALLPCFLGDSTAGLQRLPEQHTARDLASELWLLTHPDLRETVRIKVIFQLLHQQLAQQAGLIAGWTTAT